MSGKVRMEVYGAIATITLDAPASRNALTPQMLCMLADAIKEIASSTSLRVAILTGAGEKAFCAGGDLARTLPLMSGDRPPEDEWDHRLLSDPEVLAVSGLRDFQIDKPVIAAINGACMAAGFEMMLGTDLRICAEHATFALPEVKRAVIPFAGSMARLPRQVPYCTAMEMMLTGDPISAQEAWRVGLINRIVSYAELMPTARAIARQISENGPLAVQAVKRTVIASSGQPLTHAYSLEDQAKRLVMYSQDAREGPRAFMEKRAAQFFGR